MSDPRGEYGFLDFFCRNGFGRKLVSDDTGYSSVAPSTLATLVTKTITKLTLQDVGQRLRIRVRGVFAANGNSKRVQVNFGGAVVADSKASVSFNAHQFVAEGYVSRLTSTTQKVGGGVLAVTNAGAAAVLGTQLEDVDGTETLANDIDVTVKVTGTGAADVKVTSVEIWAEGLTP